MLEPAMTTQMALANLDRVVSREPSKVTDYTEELVPAEEDPIVEVLLELNRLLE